MMTALGCAGEEEESIVTSRGERERRGEYERGKAVDVLLCPVTPYISKSVEEVKKEEQEEGQVAAFIGDAITVPAR